MLLINANRLRKFDYIPNRMNLRGEYESIHWKVINNYRDFIYTVSFIDPTGNSDINGFENFMCYPIDQLHEIVANYINSFLHR